MTWNLIWRMTILLLAAVSLLLVSEYVVPSGPLHTLTHEIGFACIVSAVLWAVFELHLSRRTEEIWEKRIEHVTKNVFDGVLRKDLPQGLIDEAHRVILDSEFVRSNYQIEYGLRDSTFEASPGKVVECVEMTARLSYNLTNITKRELPIDLCIILPNPVHPELKKICDVREFRVLKGGEVLSLDLGSARTGFVEALKQSQGTEVPFRIPKIYIGSGDMISVEAEYIMPKETEDSEMLEMLYPSDSLSMTIHDRGAVGGRVVFARSVHRLPIDATEAALNPETKYLRINDYVLPCQGILVWWKRTPPP